MNKIMLFNETWTNYEIMITISLFVIVLMLFLRERQYKKKSLREVQVIEYQRDEILRLKSILEEKAA